eukprot:11211634-Lingulodinium_polyedra.AAC.1
MRARGMRPSVPTPAREEVMEKFGHAINMPNPCLYFWKLGGARVMGRGVISSPSLFAIRSRILRGRPGSPLS